MVRARFGSKEKLIAAVVSSAYEGPLTVELPETASGLDRVLARLDTMAALIDESPELLRTIFAVEFQAAGSGSRLSTRVADWIVDPGEDFASRITQWRQRTRELLAVSRRPGRPW